MFPIFLKPIEEHNKVNSTSIDHIFYAVVNTDITGHQAIFRLQIWPYGLFFRLK